MLAAPSTGAFSRSTQRLSGRTKQQLAREKNRPLDEPEDHALGRSRGGFTTKIHIVCDGTGLPIIVAVTAGQVHESTIAAALVEQISVPTGGRPKSRPERLAGDKAYSMPAFRAYLKGRRIEEVIPTRKDQVPSLRFDKKAYRQRNVIERCVGWLKECRRLAARYEKLALHYLGMLTLGMILRYLR